MSNMLVVAGKNANLARRAFSITSTATVDPDTLLSAIADGRPSQAVRFTAGGFVIVRLVAAGLTTNKITADFFSIHGHNMGVTGITIDASPDGGITWPGSPGVLVTQPGAASFLYLPGGMLANAWRFTVPGGVIGELVIAQALSLQKRPSFPLPQTFEPLLNIGMHDNGYPSTYDRSVDVLRRLVFNVDHGTHAQMREVLDHVILPSRGKVHPVIVAPEDDDATQLVVHGRLDGSFVINRQPPDHWSWSWAVKEDPSPQIVT